VRWDLEQQRLMCENLWKMLSVEWVLVEEASETSEEEAVDLSW
jgi:hypothetical protein